MIELSVRDVLDCVSDIIEEVLTFPREQQIHLGPLLIETRARRQRGSAALIRVSNKVGRELERTELCELSPAQVQVRIHEPVFDREPAPAPVRHLNSV